MGRSEHWKPTRGADTVGNPFPSAAGNPHQVKGEGAFPGSPPASPTQKHTGLPSSGNNFAISRQVGKAMADQLGFFCESSGASYAALLSENGVRIAHAGPSSDLFGRSEEVPALAIGAFFATRELAGRFGESEFEGLYQQGANRHLFLAPVGRSHLLLAVFGPPTNVGIIRICAVESCANLEQLLDTKGSAQGAPPSQETAAAAPQSPPQPAQAPVQRANPPATASRPAHSPPPVQQTPAPVPDVAQSLARPAPTGHLVPGEAKSHQPSAPSSLFSTAALLFGAEPDSSPPRSAPTISSFEDGEKPSQPFPPA